MKRKKLQKEECLVEKKKNQKKGQAELHKKETEETAKGRRE